MSSQSACGEGLYRQATKHRLGELSFSMNHALNQQELKPNAHQVFVKDSGEISQPPIGALW